MKIVVNRGILTDKDADYFDCEEYGSLEMQRIYFTEIIKVCNPFIEDEEEGRKFCELDSCGLTECARHPKNGYGLITENDMGE